MFVVLATIWILSASLASACICGNHYTNLAHAAGPIITIPANTLDKNTFVLGFGLTFTDSSRFDYTKLNRLNRKNLHAHSMDSGLNLNLNLSYGITDDFTMSMVLPFVARYGLITTDLGNTIDDGNSMGLGDISFLAKYRLLQSQDENTSFAALLGLKIPSGDTNEENEFSFKLSSDDQPGSGSWDPIMGLSFSQIFKERFFFDSNLLYVLSTPGKQNTIVGDRAMFNLGLSTSFDKLSSKNFKTSIACELNGLWQEKVESYGIKDPNHGGLIISLSPGLKLNYKNKIINNFYLSLPIIQELNGEQSGLNIQLGYNINFLF